MAAGANDPRLLDLFVDCLPQILATGRAAAGGGSSAPLTRRRRRDLGSRAGREPESTRKPTVFGEVR